MNIKHVASNIIRQKSRMKNFRLPAITCMTAFQITPSYGEQAPPDQLPNILWIVSEDNNPMLGCYGDAFATTPHLDKFASEGFRYTHAYANAPVSAPSRNTILTGVYACSAGNQQMRSRYLKSDAVHYYPEYLHRQGYYCTNNPKEDYNIDASQTKNIWNESGKNAHYRNRKPGQPFFAVFNCAISHESSLHKSIPAEQLRHDPQKVKLPPYHPDTPEMRHDWAQYYDKVEDMDAWVGNILKELEESGEADNTIVFYYADNGGVLARSKRFTYETGTHIPLIVRIPDRYKHLFPATQPGKPVDRLVSFVDFAPTLLSIIGIQAPDYMQGHAFLGAQTTPAPEYAYMFRGRMDEREDMSRAVRDNKYRYIRNYMPHRIPGKRNNYLWLAPSVPSWERAFLAGQCNREQSVFWERKPPEELYDTENDPWEIRNLAAEPAYANVLQKMREANDQWVTGIFDAGFIPEGEYDAINRRTPLYDYVRSEEYPIREIVTVANTATLGDKKNLKALTKWLKNDNRVIRYWAATGLLILNREAKGAIRQLREALADTSPEVAIVAAEVLYNLGDVQTGTEALLQALNHPDIMVRDHALAALDNINESSDRVKQAVILLRKDAENDKNAMRYDLRMADWLIKKWKIDEIK